MIKIENTEVMGWEAAIRGMRNPMNSWEKSDSESTIDLEEGRITKIGSNDLTLMKKLVAAGPAHAKYRRMITVYCDITAPLYWWKEFDTYKVGTVANSCSTMHKIADKEFTLVDFSCEHLLDSEKIFLDDHNHSGIFGCSQDFTATSKSFLQITCDLLNTYRDKYLETKDKKYWWQMIQLLPSSYNQKRTVMLNYEVLSHIYHDRKNHKLDEWCRHEPEWELDTPEYWEFGFCDWVMTLPHSELIIGYAE